MSRDPNEAREPALGRIGVEMREVEEAAPAKVRKCVKYGNKASVARV